MGNRRTFDPGMVFDISEHFLPETLGDLPHQRNLVLAHTMQMGHIPYTFNRLRSLEVCISIVRSVHASSIMSAYVCL